MSTSMNISLPAPMKRWVEQQAVKKGFGTTDAFFLEMLRKEKEMAVREHVDDLLSEALANGKPTPTTSASWERMRTKGRELAKERRRK
jgi:antitoxin ParD1/3/4